MGFSGTGQTWEILEAMKTFFNFSPVIRMAKNSFDLMNKLKNKVRDIERN